MIDRWLEVRALTGRWFIQTKRRPIVLFSGLIQPFVWLFLFSAVFKNSPLAQLHGAASYLAFITPGALVFTAFSGALNGGVPILFDREQGFLDRMLVAPLVSRFSIVWSTGIHIFAMTVLQCVVILVVTTLMGVSFAGGLSGLLVVCLTLVFITAIFTTFSLMLAFALRYHFELLAIVMIVSLPILFLSTAFAPVEFMPGWLKVLVSLNPVTLAVEPIRAVSLQADWTWQTVIYDSPFVDFSVAGCLVALVVLQVVVSLLAAAVIKRKLN
ncbi:MAG: ABC transporter permease [Acidobacteria bacterium]|nr:ABC transporter permease [Acidobacteriota bacterium]